MKMMKNKKPTEHKEQSQEVLLRLKKRTFEADLDENSDCFYLYFNSPQNKSRVVKTQSVELFNGRLLTIDFDSTNAIIGLEFV